MQMALELIESARIQPSQLITHRLPLELIVEALHLAESGKAVKVIVENQ
jgi:threonine dehydrogenase-like Zn-dependent dehydrogenase